MTGDVALRAEGVHSGYGDDADILAGVDFAARAGEVTTLIGPNGCGKSTLLKTMSKLLTPRRGRVVVGDVDLHTLSPRDAATYVAMLPQHPTAPDGLLVGELVARGRHPHQGRFRGLSHADREAIAQASEATDVTDLFDRDVYSLSGGQRQRVWLAMTLAQDTPVLLLDEPTTFLDPAHAIEMLELARAQARAGKAVVMVLHDLMLAGQYSDTMVVMKGGEIIARGTPRKTLTPEVLADAYGLRAEAWEDPRGQAPVIVPRGTISAGLREAAASTVGPSW
ncbi:ABC transporter ATP-binding protein [Corynebacterium uterequi]|uniref:ABC-type cobalamin/Fe3+-siderophore transport system, ATPase component n=1 Tax=Corynebacterium uterequi TaxID=1072256 RepID=A0A0G3HJ85_9CORY|nr:ABC transporter ATP-binding protein [Corynebacterium uterequi]AKK12018.1 ABC-type cobalamin/Fe3+-siderophore transport system, ATPase component [Corynebacterium uterequi]